METQLREVIDEELRRRHGYGLMEGKIKPVHIANALLREEHQCVGRMADLKDLMTATASRETGESQLEAVARMLDRSRERWGRLGESDDLGRSPLVTRVLPLLRTLLGTDGAAFGRSPEFSSFSSPTALTVTRDPSDDGAGRLIHRLWGQPSRIRLLDILRELTAPPGSEPAKIDDLTAVLCPLTDHTAPFRQRENVSDGEDGARLSEVEQRLRDGARDLASYEDRLLPNPISTLQRIVLLASLSVFSHAASLASGYAGPRQRVLLVDASNARTSQVAEASEASVNGLFADAREYMAALLADVLADPARIGNQTHDWCSNPEAALAETFRQRCRAHCGVPNLRAAVEVAEELRTADGDIKSELPRRLVGLLDSSGGRTLDGFIRLLGLRCGLLYPQQKNPVKRVVPMDRTLEVLVASTFDLSGPPLEFRDFLDALYERWQLIVGGRLDDARMLSEAGMSVARADLVENSERFLVRLQTLGLARKMADSVAVVGLMENRNVG